MTGKGDSRSTVNETKAEKKRWPKFHIIRDNDAIKKANKAVTMI